MRQIVAADDNIKDSRSADMDSEQLPPPATGAPTTYSRSFSFGLGQPDAGDAGPRQGEIQRSGRRWKWRWAGGTSQAAEGEVDVPVTYYEALTGRRDPHRGFFIAGRRVLDAVAWTIALGLPMGALALTVLTGQDLQTIVVMTFAAFAVGLMFKRSLPRA